MKVSELISELKKMPLEAIVYLEDYIEVVPLESIQKIKVVTKKEKMFSQSEYAKWETFEVDKYVKAPMNSRNTQAVLLTNIVDKATKTDS